MPVLPDTHVWVRWLSGIGRLFAREHEALDRLAEQRELRLSAVSPWKVQMAYVKKRFQPQDAFETWLRAATTVDVLQIVPIDARVALAMNDLPAGFHIDPADRVSAATARAHAFPLGTPDLTIRRLRMVRLWRS